LWKSQHIVSRAGIRHRQAVFVVLLSAVAAIVGLDPSAAFGSTASKAPSGKILYQADPGETNDVTIDHLIVAGTAGCEIDLCYRITDRGTTSTGAPITPTLGSGCVAGASSDQVVCPGPYPGPAATQVEVHAGDGNDSLTGSDAKESLSGEGDNDRLDGGLGNDLLDGGFTNAPTGFVDGSDTVTYANRTENVTASLGSSGNGSATVGSAETDTLVGVENLIGGSGADSLTGSQQGNVLNGGPGPDVMCGGEGFDTVDYSARSSAVNVTLDSPIAPGSFTRCPGTVASRDCVANDGGNEDGPAGDCVGEDVERVLGGAGDDILVGTDRDPLADKSSGGIPRGDNVLSGGDGNDTLDGRGGPDVLEGGDGNDTVTYAGRTSPVTATIDGVADDGGDLDFEPVSKRHDNIEGDVENVIGGDGADVLRGDGDGNVLDGRGGDDFVDGGGGDDGLLGGGGNDTLQGADGIDALNGGEGNDSLDGGSGGDALDGGPNDDVLAGGGGGDSLVGGDGTDVADYSTALGAVTVNPNGAADDGEAGEGDNVAGDVESANGGGDNDTLIGNGGDGVLNGGAGNDTLDGSGGADTLIGGPGLDAASYASRTAPVAVDLSVPGGDGEAGENDNVASDVEGVIGGAAGDTLTGNAGPNTLIGGAGRDALSGGGDSDKLVGGSDNDILSAGDGDDILSGDEGNDTLRGDAGVDTLSGGAGNDSLDGGSGADILSGDEGNDTAVYAARTRAVRVSLGDAPNDGESKEGDFAMAGVEGAKTGSGDDWIDSIDGAAGNVSCGRGEDTVLADSDDTVASDCEVVNVSASARCSVSRRSARVTMSRSGSVGIRVTCPSSARGTLRLVGGGRAISGRKSFSVRAGKSKTVKLKLTRKGRRLVRHRERLRAKATLVTRPTGTTGSAARTRTTRTVTIKPPATKRKRNKR
jgi:Ca2+-binding RTX toxin-like protein